MRVCSWFCYCCCSYCSKYVCGSEATKEAAKLRVYYKAKKNTIAKADRSLSVFEINWWAKKTKRKKPANWTEKSRKKWKNYERILFYISVNIFIFFVPFACMLALLFTLPRALEKKIPILCLCFFSMWSIYSRIYNIACLLVCVSFLHTHIHCAQ